MNIEVVVLRLRLWLCCMDGDNVVVIVVLFEKNEKIEVRVLLKEGRFECCACC